MQSEQKIIQAGVLELAAVGADAGQIADVVVSTWRNVNTALSPIIGQRAITALYKRSLHLIRADYPWLRTQYDDELESREFTALKTALSQQPPSTAVAAHVALLKTFNDLLTSLIGAALTERLLQPVWDNHSSGLAAQDTTP